MGWSEAQNSLDENDNGRGHLRNYLRLQCDASQCEAREMSRQRHYQRAMSVVEKDKTAIVLVLVKDYCERLIRLSYKTILHVYVIVTLILKAKMGVILNSKDTSTFTEDKCTC